MLVRKLLIVILTVPSCPTQESIPWPLWQVEKPLGREPGGRRGAASAETSSAPPGTQAFPKHLEVFAFPLNPRLFSGPEWPSPRQAH